MKSIAGRGDHIHSLNAQRRLTDLVTELHKVTCKVSKYGVCNAVPSKRIYFGPIFFPPPPNMFARASILASAISFSGRPTLPLWFKDAGPDPPVLGFFNKFNLRGG